MSHKPIPKSLREQLVRLDTKRQAFGGMSAPAKESLLGRLRLDLTYSSNALGGNTLSLRETQLVVEGNLTPRQGKTLREIYEARNHYAAVKEMELYVAEGRSFRARAILDLHQIVMRDIDAISGGRVRDGPSSTKGTRHVLPDTERVGEELDALMMWAGQSALHPVLLAAETHFRFESLHPFFDGNGRTGRLLMNWQLLRAGFPLTVIQVEEHARYLDALDQGHAGNLLPLQTLVATAVERSFDLVANAGQ